MPIMTSRAIRLSISDKNTLTLLRIKSNLLMQIICKQSFSIIINTYLKKSRDFYSHNKSNPCLPFFRHLIS